VKLRFSFEKIGGDTMTIPKHLSRTAKAWFKKIQNEFEIRDEAGLAAANGI
jgi:phage terminase small subunit